MAGALLAGAVISAANQVFTGVQNYFQGESTKEQLDDQAKRTEVESRAAADRIRARSRRLAGVQRSRFAAGGVERSGSAIGVVNDSIQQGEVDALTTIYRGTVSASSLRTQGSAAKKSGRNDLISSSVGAVGTVLGGVGKYNALTTNPSFKDTSFTDLGD